MLARVLLENHLWELCDFSFYPFLLKKKKISKLDVAQKSRNPRGLKTPQLIKKWAFLLKIQQVLHLRKGIPTVFWGKKKQNKKKAKEEKEIKNL